MVVLLAWYVVLFIIAKVSLGSAFTRCILLIYCSSLEFHKNFIRTFYVRYYYTEIYSNGLLQFTIDYCSTSDHFHILPFLLTKLTVCNIYDSSEYNIGANHKSNSFVLFAYHHHKINLKLKLILSLEMR